MAVSTLSSLTRVVKKKSLQYPATTLQKVFLHNKEHFSILQSIEPGMNNCMLLSFII